jgi:hypothetical protein
MGSSATNKLWLLPLCSALLMVRMIMGYSDLSILLTICGVLAPFTSSFVVPTECLADHSDTTYRKRRGDGRLVIPVHW